MPRGKKSAATELKEAVNAIVAEATTKAEVTAPDLAGVARADMPALLAKAKRDDDKPLIAAILEACRK